MKLFVLALAFLFSGAPLFAQSDTPLENDSRANSSVCGKSVNENFKVRVYEDGKLQSVKTFVKGFVTKEEISYEIDKKKISGVTRYYYTRSGKISAAEAWKNGKKVSRRDRDNEFDVDLIARYLYSADFLRKKEICIPAPGLIFSQLKDTAAVLDLADSSGGDFKKETSTDGDFRTIKFVGFNKNIRFDPTLLEIGSDQTITDYELVLKNGYLFKEIYKTGAGELKAVSSAAITREYVYQDKRLMKVVTTANLIGQDGAPFNSVTELKFVYENRDGLLRPGTAKKAGKTRAAKSKFITATALETDANNF